MRAAARRAAIIFHPPMLPDRSSTKMTSRGFCGSTSRDGGTRVSMKVPSSPLASGDSTRLVRTASSPTR
jgi:hypothetical protein